VSGGTWCALSVVGGCALSLVGGCALSVVYGSARVLEGVYVRDDCKR